MTVTKQASAPVYLFLVGAVRAGPADEKNLSEMSIAPRPPALTSRPASYSPLNEPSNPESFPQILFFSACVAGLVVGARPEFWTVERDVVPNGMGAALGGDVDDALARLPLWSAGFDYDHGTGHGVGSFLGVHEGPQRIAKAPNSVPLEPGMIVSNEPGYYKEGEFGIRIENLVIVQPSEPRPGEECAMYAFETITLCPIDTDLIDVDLLDAAELDWLNDYHATVWQKLSPRLDGDDLAWLEQATQPIQPLGEQAA